jgi:hypothetical protein
MRATVVYVAAPLAAATLIIVQANAQGRAQERDRGTGPESISSARASPGEARALIWTPAQMAAAEPVPVPVVDPQGVRAAFAARRLAGGPSGATEGKAPPQLERRAGNVKTYPLTMAGSLFFNEPNDKPGWGHACTAQFVAQNVILTASHCIQSEMPPYGYYKNFAFSLQYQNGNFKHKYGYRCVANMKGWAQQGNAHWLYDYAMILIDGASDVGWFGLEWNWQGKYNRATRLAYPKGDADGKVIQVDSGPLSVADGIVELDHGNKHEQHGASGGAWIGDYSTDTRSNQDHVISVQSFSQDEFSGIAFGPFFNEGIKTLLDYTKAGCRTPN